MKKLLFCLIFLLPVSLVAQLDSFDISGYARPDLKRKTLGFSPDFSFDYSKSSSQGLNSYSSFLDMDLTYTQFENTTTTQKSSSLFFDTPIRFRKNTNDSKNISFTPNLVFNYDIKKYKSNNQFIEVNPISNFLFSINKDLDDDSNILYSFTQSVGIYKGWGRLEYVNDAWLAVTMLKEFEELELMNGDLSNEEIATFANEIARIKNERVLDTRLKRIYELESLESYLEENTGIKSDNIRFFSTLYDNWIFESFVNRTHGNQFKIGIIPQIELRENSSRTNNLLKTISLGPELSYDSYNVLSEDWQFNHLHDIGLAYMRLSGFIPGFVEKSYDWYVATSGSLGFYPNRRNNYSLSYNLKYENIGNGDNFHYQQVIGHVNANYVRYISPQTQFSIITTLSNNSLINFNAVDRRNWDYVFAVRLNHFIF